MGRGRGDDGACGGQAAVAQKVKLTCIEWPAAGVAMRARDAPKMWRARYVDEVEAPRRGRERSRATPTLADAFGTRRGDVELAMASIPAVSARDAVRGKSLSERLSRVVSRVDEIQSSVDEAKRLLGMD